MKHFKTQLRSNHSLPLSNWMVLVKSLHLWAGLLVPRFYPWVKKIPLEKEMITHSIILTWRISWTEEPGSLQSMASQRIGHNWMTLSLSLSHTHTHTHTHTSVHIYNFVHRSMYVVPQIQKTLWWQLIPQHLALGCILWQVWCMSSFKSPVRKPHRATGTIRGTQNPWSC